MRSLVLAGVKVQGIRRNLGGVEVFVECDRVSVV